MTREEAKSCIGTIEMLQRLAYNIHGVMDVIDADNCKKIIKALEQAPTPKKSSVVEDVISRERLKQIISNITAEYDTETIHVDRLIDEIDNMPSVEPKAKSEWEHDHEILKAHSDGANELLDNIRAEIIEEVYNHSGTGEEVIQAYVDGLKKSLEFIDKHKADSEVENGNDDK